MLEELAQRRLATNAGKVHFQGLLSESEIEQKWGRAGSITLKNSNSPPPDPGRTLVGLCRVR